MAPYYLTWQQQQQLGEAKDHAAWVAMLKDFGVDIGFLVEDKYCFKCNTTKPVTEFTARQSLCKACKRAYNHDYQKRKHRK